VYRAALAERCACWNMYEVRERYALKGEGSVLSAAPVLTRLKQKTLLAFAKSYMESNMPISGPGLELVLAVNNHVER
jgi:hypothetical protein